MPCSGRSAMVTMWSREDCDGSGCYLADMAPRNDAQRVTALLSGPPATWLMTGDSITQAQNCSDGRRGYADLFAEHVRGDLRLGRVRDAVLNTGVSGSA